MEMPNTSTAPPLGAALCFCPLCDNLSLKVCHSLSTCYVQLLETDWLSIPRWLIWSFGILRLNPVRQGHSTNVTRPIAVNPKTAHDFGLIEYIVQLRSNTITVPHASSAFAGVSDACMICNVHVEDRPDLAVKKKKRLMLFLFLPPLFHICQSRRRLAWLQKGCDLA